MHQFIQLKTIAFIAALCTIFNTIAVDSKTTGVNYPYQRVDFEVKGKNCPPCIRRLVKKLRKTKGVIKTDISIKKPYSGVILLDKKLINFTKIEGKVKSEKMKTVNAEKEDLKSVPALLIPKALMKKLKMKPSHPGTKPKDNF